MATPAVVTTEEKKAAFENGLQHILRGWTCLTLAVDHSWGGRRSQEKREELYNILLLCFYSVGSDMIPYGHKRVSARSIISTEESLADFLNYQLETRFHIQQEDDQEYFEVARLMRSLADSLKAGDVSVYRKVITASTDGAKRSIGQSGSSATAYGLNQEDSLYGNVVTTATQAQPASDSTSDSESEYADETQLYEEAEHTQI